MNFYLSLSKMSQARLIMGRVWFWAQHPLPLFLPSFSLTKQQQHQQFLLLLTWHRPACGRRCRSDAAALRAAWTSPRSHRGPRKRVQGKEWRRKKERLNMVIVVAVTTPARPSLRLTSVVDSPLAASGAAPASLPAKPEGEREREIVREGER